MAIQSPNWIAVSSKVFQDLLDLNPKGDIVFTSAMNMGLVIVAVIVGVGPSVVFNGEDEYGQGHYTGDVATDG